MINDDYFASSFPDIDECQQWGLCSQTCVNFPGTYKCECLPGYTKEVTNPHKCRIADGGNPSLVFANVADIRRMDLSADGSRRGDGMELLAAHTRYATAVDFDLAANRIFWSDTNDHRCVDLAIASGTYIMGSKYDVGSKLNRE